MSSDENKQRIRQWIEKKGRVGKSTLDDDTPILEMRIISSVQIMDLILYLEHLTGNKIKIEQVQPGVFRSVNTIFKAFFEVQSRD